MAATPGPRCANHVGVAAGIFDPAPLPFGDEGRGHDAVEEVAIVADRAARCRDSRRSSPAAGRGFRGRGRWSARRGPGGSTAAPARARASAGRARRRTARRPACGPARARTGSPSCSRRRACAAPPTVDRTRRRRRSACRRRSRPGSRLSRRWSRAAICRLAPSRTVPASGASAPVSRFRSVVLPAPFGPTMPSRSPRRMRSEKSRDDRPCRRSSSRSPSPRRPACPTARPRATRHRGTARGAALLAALLPQRMQLAARGACCACAAR